MLPSIPDWVAETILVDGRSTDDTVAVARALRPDVRVIQQPGTGKGDALRAGFHAADGDIVVMLDADGSMCPTEIDSYVAMLLSGYDFVRGTRFLPGAASADITPPRLLGNRCLLWLVQMLHGASFTDLCYGYAAFWRDILPTFRLLDEPDHLGFEIETLLAVRALTNRLTVGEVPSLESKRVYGASRLNAVRDGCRVLRTILGEQSKTTAHAGFQPRVLSNSDVDCSVIICAHNADRWDDLMAAIDSVRAQRVPAREVIVVIDHNPELLAAVQRQCPDAIILANHHARGASGARNSGLSVASSDVVAFLDDDAVATDDWIEQLQKAYRDPRVMAVGGTVEPLWPGKRPKWLPTEFDWVVGCTYRGVPRSESAVRNLVGCNISFRRTVFESAGVFRTDLGRVGADGTGCEETEFCLRASRRRPHESILFKPDVRVRHHIDPRRARWSYFRSRCLAEGGSKARLSRIAGVSDSTQSERRYVSATLGSGIVREIGATLRGEPSGLVRAVVMLVGLGLTSYGYLASLVRERADVLPPEPRFAGALAGGSTAPRGDGARVHHGSEPVRARESVI